MGAIVGQLDRVAPDVTYEPQIFNLTPGMMIIIFNQNIIIIM